MFVSGCFCERQRCEIIIYLYVVGRKIKKTLALFEVRVFKISDKIFGWVRTSVLHRVVSSENDNAKEG